MASRTDPFWNPPRAFIFYAILYLSAAFAMARSRGGGREDLQFLAVALRVFFISLVPVALLLLLLWRRWSLARKGRAAVMLAAAALLSLLLLLKW